LKYLLDTNIISELISKQPNQKVLDFISSIDEVNIFLSVITIGELKSGIENIESTQRKEQLTLWFEHDLLLRFQNRIINIDTNIMIRWGKINQNLKNIGKPLPIMDSLIASSCIDSGFTLVTRNEKDFQNLDINIINPF
jgi:tRNA(fMet)-specific endonuclease VapC